MARRIAPEDTVRDVLARYPETAEVFERHGLEGCGGGEGPAERLDVFAVAHELSVDALVEALNAAVGGPAKAPAPPRAEAPLDALYRPFLLASLLCTLTLGASYGAINLLTIHLGLTVWPYFNHPLHASFQLYGFVLLFVLGVAVHAVPRFLGAPLGRPSWARASLPLVLAGLLARGAGVFLGDQPWLLLGGALALLAGIGAAALSLFSTARKPGQPRPFLPWIAAGTAWWAASAAVLAAGAAYALARGAPEEAAYFHEAAYACALLGGAVGWILGMLFRLGPAFLHLSPPQGRSGAALLLLFQLAVAASAAGALLRDVLNLGAGEWLSSGGLALTGVLLAAYTLRSGVFRAPGVRPSGDDSLRFAMQLAFGFALAFAALAALHLGLQLTIGSNHLVLDAARHALAQGFVGLAILSVATRVVPIFGGVDLAWPRLREPAVLAIAFGVALRFAEVVAGFGWMPALAVSGISGLIAGAGVAVLACSLVVTLLRRPKVAALRPVAARPEADMKVAEIIARWPQALDVLVAHGFTPLSNPVARRTLARAVTLEQACRLQGQDPVQVLADLRRALEPAGAQESRKD